MKKFLKPFAVALCICMLLTGCKKEPSATPSSEPIGNSSSIPASSSQAQGAGNSGFNFISNYKWTESPLDLDLNTDKSLNNNQLGGLSFYLDDTQLYISDTQTSPTSSFVRIDPVLKENENMDYAISFLCIEPSTTIYGLLEEEVGTEIEIYAASASPLLDFLSAFPEDNIYQYFRGKLTDDVYYSGAAYHNNQSNPCVMIFFIYEGYEYSIQFVGFGSNNAENFVNYEALVSSFDLK